MKVEIDLTLGYIDELLTFEYGMTTVVLAYMWLCKQERDRVPPAVHVRIMSRLSAKSEVDIVDTLYQAVNYWDLPQWEELEKYADYLDKYKKRANETGAKTDEQ